MGGLPKLSRSLQPPGRFPSAQVPRETLLGERSDTFFTTLRNVCRTVDATWRNECEPVSLLVCRADVPTFRKGVSPEFANVGAVEVF